MKKLLVLALVLSVATMANAAITLSITGAPETALPGQLITINITAAGSFASGEGQTIALLTTGGALTDGVVNIPPAPDATMAFGAASSTDGPKGALIDGMDGLLYGIDTFSGTGTGGAGNYISGITFTMGSAPVTITLYNNAANDFADFVAYTGVGQSVTITPEPMTLGLLGLGGLFLRRRK